LAPLRPSREPTRRVLDPLRQVKSLLRRPVAAGASLTDFRHSRRTTDASGPTGVGQGPAGGRAPVAELLYVGATTCGWQDQ